MKIWELTSGWKLAEISSYKKKWIFRKNVIEGSKICNWEMLMKKAFLIFSILALMVSVVDCSLAQDKNPKLIAVKPAYDQASNTPQNSEPAPNLQAQYDDPAPRDQLYVFWLLGRLISYPIDKVESYVSKKLYPVERPKAVPAAASGSVPSPFESINRREIPPAPPVEGKSVRVR